MKTVAIMTMLVFGVVAGATGQEKEKGLVKESTNGAMKEISFKGEVFPILKKHCLPCHAEDNANPSELSLDNHALLMAGGKHGDTFKPGKSAESMLIRKFDVKPPFGDRMPLNSRKRVADGKAKWLTEEEVKTIATWIDQGGKNN